MNSLIILILLIILGPFILIWGINELLEQAQIATQIPYNFWTWLGSIAARITIGGIPSK